MVFVGVYHKVRVTVSQYSRKLMYEKMESSTLTQLSSVNLHIIHPTRSPGPYSSGRQSVDDTLSNVANVASR